ncbi:MAG: hypothetical protein HDKAJFGB_01328 [Anaerolineae bacterium]|nr:hypothetical protein [Anaerolineae bacterium]
MQRLVICSLHSRQRHGRVGNDRAARIGFPKPMIHLGDTCNVRYAFIGKQRIELRRAAVRAAGIIHQAQRAVRRRVSAQREIQIGVLFGGAVGGRRIRRERVIRFAGNVGASVVGDQRQKNLARQVTRRGARLRQRGQGDCQDEQKRRRAQRNFCGTENPFFHTCIVWDARRGGNSTCATLARRVFLHKRVERGERARNAARRAKRVADFLTARAIARVLHRLFCARAQF